LIRSIYNKTLALFILLAFVLGTGCAQLPKKKTARHPSSRLAHLKNQNAKKPRAIKTVSKRSISKRKSGKVSPTKKKAKQEAKRRTSKEKATDQATVELNKEYFKSFLTDTGNILASPVRWDAKDWVTATFVIGVTGGLMFADEDIRDKAQSSRSSFSDDLAEVGEALGNGGYASLSLGALYLAGHALKNDKAKRAALLSFESFIISGALTQALKHMTGRERPNNRNESTNWEGPNFDGGVSFSSGHTATAFSIATIIANEYDNQPLVPPLAYSLAFLAGWSRINDNKHWASDVIFGAAMGYFTSKAILKYHKGSSPNRLAIMPMMGEDRNGVMVYYRF